MAGEEGSGGHSRRDAAAWDLQVLAGCWSRSRWRWERRARGMRRPPRTLPCNAAIGVDLDAVGVGRRGRVTGTAVEPHLDGVEDVTHGEVGAQAGFGAVVVVAGKAGLHEIAR